MTKPRRAGWGWLVYLMLVCVAVGPVARPARAQTASLRFDPSDAQVSVGQVIQIDIWVENVDDLFGVDLRFAYDPALVDIVDADSTKAGLQIESGTHPYPDFVVKNLVDEADATVWYAATQLRPREPATGSGLVARFAVLGRAAGSGFFDVINARLVTSGALEITLESSGAEISVVGVAQDTRTPLPTRTRTPTPTLASTPTPVSNLTPEVGSVTAVPTISPAATSISGYPEPDAGPSRTPNIQAPEPTADSAEAYPEVESPGLLPVQPTLVQGQAEATLPATGPTDSAQPPGEAAPVSPSLEAPIRSESQQGAAELAELIVPSQSGSAVAPAFPMLEALPTPPRAAASPKPLISKRVFLCGVVLLALLSLLLGLYLVRHERGRGARSSDEHH